MGGGVGGYRGVHRELGPYSLGGYSAVGEKASILPLCLHPFTLSKAAMCLLGYIELELVYYVCKSTLYLEHMVLQMHLIGLLLKHFASLTILKLPLLFVSTTIVPVQFR